MSNMKKYEGIIPALYACYDANGAVSVEATKALTQWFIDQGVNGLYVGGSSGECIYQTKEERKAVLEAVMEVAKGKITIIAHIACNNTADSQELAAHAESLGVDAIASIPPIYFKLPPYAIAKYWNDMSAAAPNTDFIIYNIPQLAGVALSIPLLQEMLKNPRVVGVKNSSMPVQDIQMWKDEGTKNGREFVVFNGPDEQLISGLVMGATGGIGGTYGAMPQLYVKMYQLVKAGDLATALDIQNDCCRIIYKLCSGHGNMYGMIKEALRRMGCPDCGSVRAPLAELIESDYAIVDEAVAMIQAAVAKYC
ncbi:MAG: dihydrodipicolinate synthase family protein [Oscillospiraceae bacterium]|nr:dihydrodipicolinate synthase family protein [Oscillospiraceae bacterium]